MTNPSAGKIVRDITRELRADGAFGTLHSPDETVVYQRELATLCTTGDPLWLRLDAMIADGTRIKHDHVSTVAATGPDGGDWIIKRYNHRGIRYALRQWLAGPRARHAFVRGLLLQRIGVATPRPLLYCIRYRFGLPWCSYIVNQRSAGTPLCDLFDRGELSAEDWPQAVAATREQIARLHRHRITHGDVKTPNLLWDGNTLEIIDLDALRLHRCGLLFPRFRAKDERTLAQRVEAYPQRNGVK